MVVGLIAATTTMMTTPRKAVVVVKKKTIMMMVVALAIACFFERNEEVCLGERTGQIVVWNSISKRDQREDGIRL